MVRILLSVAAMVRIATRTGSDFPNNVTADEPSPTSPSTTRPATEENRSETTNSPENRGGETDSNTTRAFDARNAETAREMTRSDESRVRNHLLRTTDNTDAPGTPATTTPRTSDPQGPATTAPTRRRAFSTDEASPEARAESSPRTVVDWKADRKVWEGEWWPMRETNANGGDPEHNLYAPGGPLEKYDKAFGTKSQEYERANSFRPNDSDSP